MNPLMQWLGRPEWDLIVRTLAHSIWQGALLAGALACVTRWVVSPVVRYRCAVATLGLALMAGVLTWGVIGNNGKPSVPDSTSVSVGQTASLTMGASIDQAPSQRANVVSSEPGRLVRPAPARKTAWIALLWLAGAAAMLVRGGIKVAGAEALRRSCQTTVDPALANLLDEARRAVGLTRRVRLAITDKLTSPVVVGWLVPTLILPLTLVTTMTPEQIRFILLHELAHIRRGDYLINLFQLFVESVFFFNPAIWWISHQIRREREACCDALASRLGGEPVAYARTLIEAAERGMAAPFAAAPALGERQPSHLTERVRRILMPGYRPSMRLTWRAISIFLVVGGAAVMLSAVGAKVAVAAIMTPQQRIERIEKKMTEYGQNPQTHAQQNSDRVSVTARIKTPDGSPLPAKKSLLFYYATPNVSGVSSGLLRGDGSVSGKLGHGQIWIQVEAEGYALTVAGPFDGTMTNNIDVGELTLSHGFDVSLQVVDATTGRPVPEARLHTQFWLRGAGHGLKGEELTADSAGRASLTHCVDQTLEVAVKAPGYEMSEQRFEHLQPSQDLVIKLYPGVIIGGDVVENETGKPVAGAAIRVLKEKGPNNARYSWDDALRIVAKTDTVGRFDASRFRRDTAYWLGFSAPGHGSVTLGPVAPGTTNLIARLGPELVVRGHVIGDLSRLFTRDGKPGLSCTWSQEIENDSRGELLWANCWTDNGVMRFEFTQPVAGLVTASTKDGQRFERRVDAPVDDWVIDLNTPKPSPTNMPQREVIVRFKYPAGVPPAGTVSVTIPDSIEPNHQTVHSSELQITNSQVSFQIPIGGNTDVEPKRLAGYWFERIGAINVTNGPGPMFIDVPLVPAGAIYARASTPDVPGQRVFFGMEEIERAPTRRAGSFLADSTSPHTPLNQFVFGPLPLGGTYQVWAWHDRTFAVSKRIKLTEQHPDAEVELRLPLGKTLNGLLLDPAGKPIPNAGLELTFWLSKSHSFGLHSVFTDDQGRFQVTGTTPEVGQYSVEPRVPGLLAERIDLDGGSALQKIRLQKGLPISGQVIEEGTGRVIPNAEVRALAFEQNGRWPQQKTITDAQGRFQFTTLADAKYRFFVDGGQEQNQQEVNPTVKTNVTVTIKLYPWSKLNPSPER